MLLVKHDKNTKNAVISTANEGQIFSDNSMLAFLPPKPKGQGDEYEAGDETMIGILQSPM